MQGKRLKSRNWVYEDLPQTTDELQHIVIKPSVADFPRSPSKTFEPFLDNKATEHSTVETAKYSSQSENHNFVISTDEMRAFIGVLLLQGYSSVPRLKETVLVERG